MKRRTDIIRGLFGIAGSASTPGLGSGVLWSLLASGAAQGSTFVLGVLLARLLGQVRFGEYALVLSTLLSISMLAQLALGSTATRYVAELRATDPLRAGRVIGLLTLAAALTGVVAGFAVLAAAPVLARSVFAAPQLTGALRFGAAYIVFTTIAGLLTGVIAGFGAYRALGKAMAVWAPLHVLVCAVGAVLAGVQGATAGLAIGAIIQAAVLARQVSAEAAAAGIPVGFRNLLPELNVVGQYAVPAAIAGYISVPAVWWGNLLLARQTDGFTELALYNAAWSFRVLTLIVPVNINRVAGSMLYYQQGTDDQDGFRQVFWSNVAACTGFACLAGIAVAWGRDALLGLFGSAFVAAADVLLLLLISALLEAAALGVYQIIQTQKRMWLSMLAVAIPNYATFVLVGTILVPRAGGAGLAVASIAAWAVALIAISVTALRTGLTFRAWPHASKGTLPIIQAG